MIRNSSFKYKRLVLYISQKRYFEKTINSVNLNKDFDTLFEFYQPELFYLLLIFKNIIVLLRDGFIELILFFILDYI